MPQANTAHHGADAILRIALALLLSGSTSATALAGTKGAKGADTQQAARLTEKVEEDGGIEQQIDINGDGRIDVYNHYRETEP